MTRIASSHFATAMQREAHDYHRALADLELARVAQPFPCLLTVLRTADHRAGAPASGVLFTINTPIGPRCPSALTDGPVLMIGFDVEAGGDDLLDLQEYDTLRDALVDLYGPTEGDPRPFWMLPNADAVLASGFPTA